MTARELRADGLRTKHLLDHGITDALPWESLQDSEQERWLQAVVDDLYYLTVPDTLPKSFNQLGASGNWRGWQTAKKTWERRFVRLLDEHDVPQRTGLFARTTAILTVPTRRRRDAGNFGVVLEKALGDALQIAGVIDDDTPEFWSWTSVTFTHTPGVSATTIVLALVDPLSTAVAA